MLMCCNCYQMTTDNEIIQTRRFPISDKTKDIFMTNLQNIKINLRCLLKSDPGHSKQTKSPQKMSPLSTKYIHMVYVKYIW